MTFFIGYHIAKTGGTTVLSHMIENFPEGRILSFGLNNAGERLFSDYPIASDEPEEKRAQYSVMFGHGINESAVRLAATLLAERGKRPEEIEMFTILREPFPLFRSTYSQAYNGRLKGQDVSPEKFLEMTGPNRLATSVWKRFGWLVGGGEYSTEGVMKTLSCFKHIITTETLNAGSSALIKAMGLPPINTHRRPTAKHEALGSITPASMRDHSAFDYEIWQAVTDGSYQTSAGSFAFDPGFCAARFGALKALSPREEVETLAQLALAGIRKHNRHVRAKAAFRAGVHKSLAATFINDAPTLLKDATQTRDSYFQAVQYLRRNNKPAEVVRLAEEAKELGVDLAEFDRPLDWAKRRLKKIGGNSE